MGNNIAMLKERFVNKSVLSIAITDLYNHFMKGLYYKDNLNVDYINLMLYLKSRYTLKNKD
jgi:hypothetical protein